MCELCQDALWQGAGPWSAWHAGERWARPTTSEADTITPAAAAGDTVLDPAGPFEGSQTSGAPKSGDLRIDNLLANAKWGEAVGSGAVIEYSFAGPGSVFDAGYGSNEPATLAALSATQQAAVRNALGLWSELANLTFVEVDETADHVGVMRFGRSSAPSTAWAYYPAAGYPEGGDVWFGPNYAPDASYAPGTYNYSTVVHEIGHALGLKHPHATGGSNVIYGTGEDWLGNSVMSYRSYLNDSVTSGGYSNAIFPAGPMLNDVAAMQYLYGTNTATRADDTVYRWAPGQRLFETIYDAGGKDRIDWSNQATAAVINLASGAWSELGPAYTWKDGAQSGSYKTTLAIARGTSIEDAAGGSANDIVTGNAGDNSLEGNNGADDLFGGEGNDRLVGGNGDDDLIGGNGSDEFWGGAGNDSFTVTGNFGADVIHDAEGANRVVFTDTQQSQASFADTGGDLLVTIAGRDGSIVIDDYYASSLTFQLSFVPPPPINGTSGVDRLYGTNSDNTMSGLAGNDSIYGGGGNDRISAGNGNDSAFGDSGNDVLLGEAGNDLLTGGAGRDSLTGGAGNDTFDFDALTDSLPGTGIRDLITDFKSGQNDRIDLRGIDARTLTLADDAFTWRGTSAFTTDATGQLRYTRSGSITTIEASTDADTDAEFQVELTGSLTLQAHYFFL